LIKKGARTWHETNHSSQRGEGLAGPSLNLAKRRGYGDSEHKINGIATVTPAMSGNKEKLFKNCTFL